MEEKKKGFFSGIGANILLLGLVSLFTDMSSEMIQPVLPLFLAGLGAGAVTIGLVGGLGDSVSAIVSLLAGYSSDRNGRRIPYIFAGYGISTATKFLFAFATQPWHIAVLKPIERVGKGLRGAPRDSIIAESKKEVRGKAFGIHRSMDNFGAALGTIISIFIILFFLDQGDPMNTYRNIFIIAGVIGLIALIPIFFVKDVKREPQKRGILLNLRDMPQNYRIFLVVTTIFSLGNFTVLLFISHAQKVFQTISAKQEIILIIPLALYLWFNIVNTLFSVPAGLLSDRFGRKKILALGYILFTLSCLGFAYTSNILSFIILFAVYGIAIAFVDGTQRALAADLIPPEIRGTALGTYYMLTAIATLPGSVFAGFFWENYGAPAAFIYGAAMTVFAMIVFLLIRNHRKEAA